MSMNSCDRNDKIKPYHRRLLIISLALLMIALVLYLSPSAIRTTFQIGILDYMRFYLMKPFLCFGSAFAVSILFCMGTRYFQSGVLCKILLGVGLTGGIGYLILAFFSILQALGVCPVSFPKSAADIGFYLAFFPGCVLHSISGAMLGIGLTRLGENRIG